MVFGIVINAILMVVSYSLYEVAPAPATAVNWLSTVTTMLVVIALFRGKKDALAAIFFLITAVVLVAKPVYEKDSFEAPCSVQTEESPC